MLGYRNSVQIQVFKLFRFLSLHLSSIVKVHSLHGKSPEMTFDSINEGIARMGTQQDVITTEEEKSMMPGVYSEEDWAGLRELSRKLKKPVYCKYFCEEPEDAEAELQRTSNDIQLPLIIYWKKTDEDTMPVRPANRTEEYVKVSIWDGIFALFSYLFNKTNISQ